MFKILVVEKYLFKKNLVQCIKKAFSFYKKKIQNLCKLLYVLAIV